MFITEKDIPNLKGDKVPVTVYLEPSVFMKVELDRKEVKRSTYLEKMIKEEFEAC